MTINQFAFNNTANDTLSIAFEVDQFINHDTTDFEIEKALGEIGETLEKHFKFYRDQKVSAENTRIAQEAALAAASQKTSKVFSSFKNKLAPVVAKPVAPVSDSEATVESILPVLQNLGMLTQSFLPDVYRFQGSSYAYTIKNNTWCSPLGNEGKGAKSFLEDVAEYVFKMDSGATEAFIRKVNSM